MWRSFVTIRPRCVQEHPSRALPDDMTHCTVHVCLHQLSKTQHCSYFMFVTRGPGPRFSLDTAFTDPGGSYRQWSSTSRLSSPPAEREPLLWCDRSNHRHARQNIQPQPQMQQLQMQQLLPQPAVYLKSFTPGWNSLCLISMKPRRWMAASTQLNDGIFWALPGEKLSSLYVPKSKYGVVD